MASSDQRPANTSRRFKWLAAAIVGVILAYTGAWYYGAGVVLDRVNSSFAALNRDGRRINCENTEVLGYPFRMGISCRTVLFEDARAGIGVRAHKFRTSSYVYTPNRSITEVEGPAILQFPGLNPLELTWNTLRATTRLASPLPERVSIESKGLSVRLDELGDVTPLLFKADLFEVHMRPQQDDLDVALRFGGLSFNDEVVTLPSFSGVVDAQLMDGALLDLGGPGLRNRSGVLRDATVTIEGGSAGASLSGPFSIDDAGMIDAELQIVLRNPAQLSAVLAELFPDARQEIELGIAGVAAMGNTTSLPLRIKKGEVRLGFFVLGFIPPV